MEKYKNLGRNSSVSAYETGNDYIKIEFCQTNHVLKFSYRSAGRKHVEMMKMLAIKGNGLGHYIESNMKVR